jgi:hypothetical protein
LTTIDFGKALADAKSASFEAMPKGDYNIEVVQADATTASTGRPMIKTKMKVIDGPYQNRPVMTQFVLSIDNPNALSMFFRNMRAFGIEESFFAQMGGNGSLEPVAAALVGRRAQVTLGIRQWQGEDRNEVSGIKKYTGAPGTVTGVPSGPGGLPGMPGVPSVGPGPIASIPGQVMQQAAQNFNPTTQLPNQLPVQTHPSTPAPAVQAPPQAPQPAQAPVAPLAAPQAVQAPVAPEPVRTPDVIEATQPPAWLPTPEETQAATPPQVPTAAETAPPAYAQPQVQQYVDSNAQAMPVPPTSPI